MRTVATFLSTLALLAAGLASPLGAQTGPCQPDKDGGLTCGSGPGAARVVEGTMSPSKRFAFAWRALGSSSADDPDPDKVENLLIRISDGAVLWSARGRFAVQPHRRGRGLVAQQPLRRRGHGFQVVHGRTSFFLDRGRRQAYRSRSPRDHRARGAQAAARTREERVRLHFFCHVV